MKTLTLLAALVALVSAATPAIAPGMAVQAQPIMVADNGGGFRASLRCAARGAAVPCSATQRAGEGRW
jgi:hypothetical protein